MRVVVVDDQSIDLRGSVLHEELPDSSTFEILQSEQRFTAVAAFDSDMKLLPLVSEFLSIQLQRGNISDTTAKTYGLNLIYFIDYLKKLDLFKDDELDSCLLDVQRYKFEEYCAYLKSDKGLASTTIRNRDATYKAFYDDFLCADLNGRNALRVDNPYEEGLVTGAPNQAGIEMCSINEFSALLQCSYCERERALIQFMYDSGLRRSEVPRVTKSQVSKALSENARAVVLDEFNFVYPSDYKRFYVAGSKGRKREIKPRFTIISTDTLVRVARYHSSPLYRKTSKKFGSEAPAFLNAEGGKYTPSSINKLLLKLSKRALKRGLITRPIAPHMLRHGFAGTLLRSPDLGNDAVDRLVILQQCLGHADLKTTNIYTGIPYELFGQYIDKDTGEIVPRCKLMGKMWKKTKKAIKLGDVK
ncbi:tyrosine-type recombinase/integrase [Photobacterium swingsii]|uniref:tyrosine-type recombinase/integrase n=1 Tax=Photobacterium swingsii TaxID=680026 RepID=UPI0040685F11